MKKKSISIVTATKLSAISLVAILMYSCSDTPIPPDCKNSCPVSAAKFNSWFESGAVSLNGVVNPANSITFPDVPNCSFYEWSEQMFLWALSPAPKSYGGGKNIFDSPVFYDVSPLDSNGDRTFIPHTPGLLRNLSLRAAQKGAHNLPILIDRKGQMFEIEKPTFSPKGNTLIQDAKGKMVEISSIELDQRNTPIFKDVTGKVIERPVPMIRKELLDGALKMNKQPMFVQKFTVNGKSIFLNHLGQTVDAEQGQAGGGDVLRAQNGSLIYYVSMVNDVYAYFLTGAKNGSITPTPTQFPTTQAALTKITDFGRAHGKTFVDSVALCIELKTSWIEAAGVPNIDSYVTMDADIPTYDTTNPNLWVQTGFRRAKLAMLGMHVVGSTKGHPEMLWATFEHLHNAPNAAYSYINASNVTVNVPQATTGLWWFCQNNSAGPFNQSHMAMAANGKDIEAIAPFTVSPSNTIRWKAWGAASNQRPNPAVANTAASNSEIISMNNNVRGQLINGDVRRSYFFTGCTWTIGGAAPTGAFGSSPTANEVGTSQMNNTTMETYQQGNNTQFNALNCFTCHGSNTVDVSHIYFTPGTGQTHGLKPLFP